MVSVAKTVADCLFQLFAESGMASLADVFNPGFAIATKMLGKAQFGLFEDNRLTISAISTMVIAVISSSLAAALFVSVMAKMYIRLLADMIIPGGS